MEYLNRHNYCKLEENKFFINQLNIKKIILSAIIHLKEVSMAKFFLMGNFTEKAFAGFLKDPGSDRSEAARKCSESVGAEMKSYTYLRGPYDFMVETHGTFEQMAAIKMATEGSGALKNIAICEETPLNEIANHATKVSSGYKVPGQ